MKLKYMKTFTSVVILKYYSVRLFPFVSCREIKYILLIIYKIFRHFYTKHCVETLRIYLLLLVRDAEITYLNGN